MSSETGNRASARPAMSQLTQARSLKTLLINGTLWGFYNQIIPITGPVFAGYALWLGLQASDIAVAASVVSFAGLIQPFSFLISRSIKNQKAYILACGTAEVSLVVSILLVPFLLPYQGGRLILVSILALTGTLMGNLGSPLFNSWFSACMPEDSRARFLSRRMVLANLAAMVAGYLTGQFIDLMGGSYVAFLVPYLLAWLAGAGGYWMLLTMPYPSSTKAEGEVNFRGTLLAPFKHKQFRRLMLFYLSWAAAVMISDPFMNVYMIKDLTVSYSAIGLYNVITLLVGILGYWLWGSIIERYGAKPVLQMLMVPRFILPLVWIFLNPGNASGILPLIMVANGLVFSGLTVAINTMLFGIVPSGSDRPLYFAVWAFSNSLLNSAASAVAAVGAGVLAGTDLFLGPVHVTNLRIMFFISSMFLILPLFLLRRVSDITAKPVTYMMGQMLRGNTLAFVYNSFLFSRVKETGRRARAARSMGRSRSPMAVEHLVQALGDIDPVVREQAVKGLGETQAVEAVEPLIRELTDKESDIRVHAAASLGALRNPTAVGALLRVLEEPGVSLQAAAIRALGRIGGEEVRESLYQRLRTDTRTALIPTYVESLSRMGDLRAVRPAIEGVKHFANPVLRLQLLNAVCRSLGAQNLFADLLGEDRLPLAERLYGMLHKAENNIRKLPQDRAQKDSLMWSSAGLTAEPSAGRQKTDLLACFTEIGRALEESRYGEMPVLALKIAEALRSPDPVAHEGLWALRRYVEGNQSDRPEVFAMVCLERIVHAAV